MFVITSVGKLKKGSFKKVKKKVNILLFIGMLIGIEIRGEIIFVPLIKKESVPCEYLFNNF